MSATIVNPAQAGLKTYEDNGNGTGAMHVIMDGGGVNTVTTSTPTSVAASATSAQLLAANTARKGGSIYNDSDKIMWVKYGAGASTTSYKTQIPVGGFWAFPLPIYTGIIHAIWEAAPTGNARISEET